MAENLFSAWNEVADRLKKEYLYLFLDCDGTLAPIAPTPAEATVPQETIEVLSRLSRTKKVRLAVISGRSLADIRKVVGLDGIIYAGNHGMEVAGPGMTTSWKAPADYDKEINRIKALLEKEFSGDPGIFVEDKGLSMCLHYRKASMEEKKIKELFRKVMEPYVKKGSISALEGKKVMEIRPAVGLNKGKIVKWLLTREGIATGETRITAVYVGDDRTDEDAFHALGPGGISILVGDNPSSSAVYSVENTGDVLKFLKMILELRG